MKENIHIHINYEKVREITQGAKENPASLLTCFTEAVKVYLDITTPSGLLYLHVQFHQSFSDIRLPA